MGLSHESEWTKSAEHLSASPCMTDLSIDTTFSLIDTTFSRTNLIEQSL
jgi:hypothetical protein